MEKSAPALTPLIPAKAGIQVLSVAKGPFPGAARRCNLPPMSRKLNHDQKVALHAAEVAKFIEQYARKSQKGGEPNDRRYDRRLEAKIKRLRPEYLDRLLRDDEDGPADA